MRCSLFIFFIGVLFSNKFFLCADRNLKVVSGGISRLPFPDDSFVVDRGSVSEFLLGGSEGGDVDGVVYRLSVLISPGDKFAVELAKGSGRIGGMTVMHSPHLMPPTAWVPFTHK